MRRVVLALALTLVLFACGDDGTGATTTGATPTTASSTDTSPSGSTASSPDAPALEIDDDKRVVIDWEAVTEASFLAPVPNATDPLFFVHNQPDVDGFYLGLEAYTVFGPGWTGELGTFAIDCENNGICLHFDPDGRGPAIDAGFDFMATGTIEIVRADLEGFEAILTDVSFTDGHTIPGPLRITGGE